MINEFKGDNEFLSNFYIEKDGFSLEHVYQAAKTPDPDKAEWILASATPAIAKKRGRQVPIREEWDEVKLKVMEIFLRNKFSRDLELRDKLVATGDEELVEGNWWGDTYWGVCNGVGENHLGKLLMKIRKELNDAAHN